MGYAFRTQTTRYTLLLDLKFKNNQVLASVKEYKVLTKCIALANSLLRYKLFRVLASRG